MEKGKEERAKEAEQKKKLLETQNQIHSPDRVNLEELKEKHRKLELAAKTNEEILNTWKIKLDDYKLAVVDLKEGREREEQEKNRFLELFSLESKETGRLRAEKAGLEKKLETEQIKYTTEKYEKEQERQEHEKESQKWKDDMDKRLTELYKEIDKNLVLANQATDYPALKLATTNKQSRIYGMTWRN